MRRILIALSTFGLLSLSVSSSYAERLHDYAFLTGLAEQIDFTPTEISQHQSGLATLIATTNAATQMQVDLERSWFDRCHMGVMYGYVSPYSKMTSSQRQTYIAANAKCSVPPSLTDVGVTSCEMFTNKFLAKGFASIGQLDVFKRINTFLNANDRDGLALVFALRKLGWKTLYWNTDVHTAPPLPKNRAIVGVTPADHFSDTKIALNRHVYHGIGIDGYLIDFSPNPGSSTIKDDSVLSKLRKVPYFVGISHAGFHVWSGSYGTVTESHSFFDPADKRNIQVGVFEPQHASPTCREVLVAGKAQTYCYYSGIIAVPPGPWAWL